MKIYVGNLSYTTGDAELTRLFSGIGAVDSVQIIRDRATGRSKGFAFVEMGNADEANAACRTLHETQLDGRRLTVNEARPMEKRPDGHFGTGYGRQKREARW